MAAKARFHDALRVKPGSRARLSTFDPATTLGFERDAAREAMSAAQARLTDLQDRLWAEGKHAVLVVLQGIDTAGKDGVIRKVITAFNPQGCTVSAFKVPSADELAHDFLWRVHQRVPRKGEIAIFNRSHYEQVLVVRVHGLEPRGTWSKHYAQINDFERMLTETGTTVVKFFLLIDRDEQRRRFQARLDEPTKRWKFSMGDLEDRARWDDYQGAFEAVLSRTSTAWAPWYVIPANHKWFRDLAVATILADTIAELRPTYPAPPDLPPDLTIQ